MRPNIAARHRLRVKQRRRIVEYAREHGIKPAGRHFGLDRRTIRAWLRRWKAGGDEGLVPRYPARRKRRLPDTTRELIRVARVEHRYGAPRTQIWLKRVHHLQVNTRTIQRIFREIGIPLLTKTPKRRPRQMMLFEKDEPGDSVQVDVKVVQLQREKVFQYTAIDDCTRYRLLRLLLAAESTREPALLGGTAPPAAVHHSEAAVRQRAISEVKKTELRRTGTTRLKKRHDDIQTASAETERRAHHSHRGSRLTPSPCQGFIQRRNPGGRSAHYLRGRRYASTARGEGIRPPGLVASGKRR